MNKCKSMRETNRIRTKISISARKMHFAISNDHVERTWCLTLFCLFIYVSIKVFKCHSIGERHPRGARVLIPSLLILAYFPSVWPYLYTCTYIFSYGLGSVILGIGILTLLGIWFSKIGFLGGLLTFGMSLVTLTFLLTTPEVFVPNLGQF